MPGSPPKECETGYISDDLVYGEAPWVGSMSERVVFDACSSSWRVKERKSFS
jgi:hypothetical protein